MEIPGSHTGRRLGTGWSLRLSVSEHLSIQHRSSVSKLISEQKNNLLDVQTSGVRTTLVIVATCGAVSRIVTALSIAVISIQPRDLYGPMSRNGVWRALGCELLVTVSRRVWKGSKLRDPSYRSTPDKWF